MIRIIDLDLIACIMLTYYIIYYSVFVIHNGVILLVWRQNTSVSIGRPRWGTTRCEIHHSMKFRPWPIKFWWQSMIRIIDLDLISMILLTYYILYQLVLSMLYRIIYKLEVASGSCGMQTCGGPTRVLPCKTRKRYSNIFTVHST